MRGEPLGLYKKVGKFLLLFLTLAGLLLTAAYGGSSRSLADFTPSAAVQISSCDNLLTQLNYVHPHNVAKVVNCQASTTLVGRIFTEIEFNPYTYDSNITPGNPPANLWYSCAGGPNNLRPDPSLGCYTAGQYSGAEIGNMDTYETFPWLTMCAATGNPPSIHPVTKWSCTSDVVATKGTIMTETMRAFVSFYVQQSNLSLTLTGALNKDKTATLTYGCTITGSTCDETNNLTLDQGIGKVKAPSGTSTTKDPLTKDTTFTLTATDKSGKLVTVSTTVSLSANAPDLTIDLKQIGLDYVDIKGTDKTAKHLTKAPFLVGTDTAAVAFDNVIVKNIGSGEADGTISVEFTVCGLTNVDDKYINPSNEQISLQPGASLTIDKSKWFGSWTEPEHYFLSVTYALMMQNSCPLDAVLKFTPNANHLDETNKTNNGGKLDNFVDWPTISVTVKSGNNPVEAAYVHITSPTNESGAAVTDGNGHTEIITEAPRNGVKVYTLSVTVGGVAMGSAQAISVSEGKDYPVSFSIPWFVAVKPGLSFDVHTDDNYNGYEATGGTVAIARETRSGSGGVTPLGTADTNSQPSVLLTASVKEGLAVFTKTAYPNLIDGTYDIKPSTAQLSLTVWKPNDYQVTYQWPEKSRSQSSLESFVVNSSTIFEKPLGMLLAQNCPTDKVIAKVCIYDDVANINNIKANLLPKAVDYVVSRYKTLPESLNLNTAKIGFTPDLTLAAFYDPRDPDLISISRVTTLATGENQILVVSHELIHMLDDAQVPGAGFLSNANTDYMKSIDSQLGSADGQKLWDLISYNCAYTPAEECKGGYSAAVFAVISNPARRHMEAMAEEYSTLFTYGPEAHFAKLDDIDRLWQNHYHTAPPADVAALVTNVRNRLQGKFVDTQGNYTITFPFLADFYKLCLGNTYP